jgi:hypothetical protein
MCAHDHDVHQGGNGMAEDKRNSRSFAITWASGIALLLAASAGWGDESSTGVFQNGKAGFVVTGFRYALNADADEHGACPAGLATGPRKAFESSPDGKRHDDETDEEYTRRLQRGAYALMSNQKGDNLCLHPELAAPDPAFRIVSGNAIKVLGMDLDGQRSRLKGKPAPGTCAHDDFPGVDGEEVVDNQFYRAVGCISSFQANGQSNIFEIGMLAGEWGILITLAGVDDPRNDKDVEVGFYANADPIQLSAKREPLPYATYAAEQDPRFSATFHGRIVNGVLTAGPFDLRIHKVTGAMRLERVLKHARIRLTLSPQGTLEGLLSGYTPVDDAYDLQFGHRNGTDAAGKPAPQLQRLVSNGSSFNFGYSCPGIYYALRQLADGDRDPTTGQCTSISTQYVLRAIPAFVVQVKTRSVNSALESSQRAD